MSIAAKERQIIQDYYGCNVKIKIKRNGEVHYYGSQNAFNRQHDYWHYGGQVEDILREAKCRTKSREEGEENEGFRNQKG